MGNFDGLVCGHKRTLLIGLPVVGAVTELACQSGKMSDLKLELMQLLWSNFIFGLKFFKPV